MLGNMSSCIMLTLASYPDLLTQAFVTCSTSTGEDLIELTVYNVIPKHVEE